MANEQPDKSPPRKRTLKDSAAWLPSPWELADITALQAVAAGNASPEQQRRALDWIVLQAAATYERTYRPESARDTDFMCGRQYVGQQIRMLLTLNPSALRRNEPQADAGEPKS